MDFSSLKLSADDYVNLEKRTFKTYDFYRQYQDDITPAGLAFYQTNYDKSLTKFYHEVLSKYIHSYFTLKTMQINILFFFF